MTSILNTIKKLLGLDPQYEAFDTDIIVGINTAIMALKQMGIGKSNFYGIVDATATWTDLLGSDKDYEGVKTYIYIKTRTVFDPPTSSMVQQALNEQLKEIEYRLYQQAEFVDADTTVKPTSSFDLIVDEDGDATIKFN